MKIKTQFIAPYLLSAALIMAAPSIGRDTGMSDISKRYTKSKQDSTNTDSAEATDNPNINTKVANVANNANISTKNTNNANISAKATNNAGIKETYTIPTLAGIHSTGKNVIFTYSDSTVIERKGTIAWRNNNPGCLRYSEFTKKHGAIGKACGYAVFPDAETGMNALRQLLRSDTYQKLTVHAAVKRYATVNTDGYMAKLKKLANIGPDEKMNNLTDEQLEVVAQSIIKIEGFVPGKENVLAVKDSTSLQYLTRNNQHSR